MVNTCIYKLVSVATDGYPNVSGENVDPKGTQDRVTEINAKQELFFLHCMIIRADRYVVERSGGSQWEKD